MGLILPGSLGDRDTPRGSRKTKSMRQRWATVRARIAPRGGWGDKRQLSRRIAGVETGYEVSRNLSAIFE
jgi:hypothetical protein